jgi:FkbM family methyltransferase
VKVPAPLGLAALTPSQAVALPRGWRAFGRAFRAAPGVPGKWRVGAKLAERFVRGYGYETTIRFDRGQQIVLQLDDWIPFQIFLTGTYAIEEAQTRYFRRLVRPGMVVVDVGANIGYYTLQAASRVGSSGRVHAFEPVAATYARLVRNIRLNGLANVVALQSAVGSRRGRERIFLADGSNTASSRLSGPPPNPTGRTEDVEIGTLDDYVAGRRIPRVDIVKIDVEGHELAVLQGMERLLVHGAPLVLLEVVEDAASPLFEHLGERGYRGSRMTRKGLMPIEPADVGVKESLVLFQRSG